MKFRYKATIEGRVNSLFAMIEDTTINSCQCDEICSWFKKLIKNNEDLSNEEKYWLISELNQWNPSAELLYADPHETSISQASRKIDKIRNKFLKSLLNGCDLEISIDENHSIRISKITKHHDSDRACNTISIDC